MGRMGGAPRSGKQPGRLPRGYQDSGGWVAPKARASADASRATGTRPPDYLGYAALELAGWAEHLARMFEPGAVITDDRAVQKIVAAYRVAFGHHPQDAARQRRAGPVSWRTGSPGHGPLLRTVLAPTWMTTTYAACGSPRPESPSSATLCQRSPMRRSGSSTMPAASGEAAGARAASTWNAPSFTS